MSPGGSGTAVAKRYRMTGDPETPGAVARHAASPKQNNSSTEPWAKSSTPSPRARWPLTVNGTAGLTNACVPGQSAGGAARGALTNVNTPQSEPASKTRKVQEVAPSWISPPEAAPPPRVKG